MTVRRAAALFVGAGKRYRRIIGQRDFWTLKAHSDGLGAPRVTRKATAR